jgi:hypothetical protein
MTTELEVYLSEALAAVLPSADPGFAFFYSEFVLFAKVGAEFPMAFSDKATLGTNRWVSSYDMVSEFGVRSEAQHSLCTVRCGIHFRFVGFLNNGEWLL